MKLQQILQFNLFSIPGRELLAFVFCVLVSIFTIFSGDSPQVHSLRALVVNTLAWGMERVSPGAPGVSAEQELARLRQRTTKLLLENGQLRDALFENMRLRTMLELQKESPYTLVAAEIIQLARDRAIRSATLNVGSNQGIARDMPVISPDGLCGKIIQAGATSSVVQLLPDYNFRVACRIERSRVDGILITEGGTMSWLRQVPKNADVVVGDVVVTSGLSLLFPADLRVGTVVEVEKEPHTLFKRVRVAPSVPFSHLEEVFVITSTGNASSQ